MKKYWKSIAIIVGIVLSIGTFYANSARSATHYPDFVIQTLSGDSQEVESMVLEGTYNDALSINYISTNLKITAQGTSYTDSSFLNQLKGQYPTVIEELQEEYHSFMRGKSSLVNLYYEDNEFLAYADVDYKSGSLRSEDFIFELSLFNKKNNKTNSFTLELPERAELDHVFVEDVQLVENMLYIITQNTVRKNEEFIDEKHLYEIDMGSQKIISHIALLEVIQGKEDLYTDMRLIESSPTAPNQHIILLKTEETIKQEAESIQVTDSKHEIISYNLATKEKETVAVPGLSLGENQLSFVEGSTFYFTRAEKQELIVTPYRLGQNQVDQDYRIPLQATMEKEEGQSPMIKVKEGKLYVVSQYMNSKSNGDIVVVDVQTRETLFKGQIAAKNSSREKADFDLYLHAVDVK